MTVQLSLRLPSLKSRALRLLSQREHSRFELERKLQKFEETPGSLAQVLDELQAQGWISESRVIESVLHRRCAQLGMARIKQELHDKKLDPQKVAQALHSLRATETQRAVALWRKKFALAPRNAQEAAKQMRFLSARGFAAETVRRVVQQGWGEDEAGPDSEPI